MNKNICLVLVGVLILSLASVSEASDVTVDQLKPGSMVKPTDDFVPILLKGMTIYPNEPLRLDFIVDNGFNDFTADERKDKAGKLLRYFMAALTIPKSELWVNLSPYESDRIITEALSRTELGRDMLLEDYLLKQLTASLMHPKEELGAKFWQRVQEKVYEQYGVAELPATTFNKVWILPNKAVIYEHDNSVEIVDYSLKVMLDQDYMALKEHKKEQFGYSQREESEEEKEMTALTSTIIRDLIVPEIEREVNKGDNFTLLRQIYNSLILAKWYKETITNSVFSQVYADKNKVFGIDLSEPEIKDKVYEKYLEAFQVGIFDYIKEEYDPATQEMVSKKYFSGGISGLMDVPLERALVNTSMGFKGDRAVLQVGNIVHKNIDKAVLTKASSEDPGTEDIRMMDMLFMQAQKRERWPKNKHLKLEIVADAIMEILNEGESTVELETVNNYLINISGYPILGNKHLGVSEPVELSGVSKGEGVGIGKAVFFEREDAVFTYPFVAPLDTQEQRDKNIEYERELVDSTFDNFFDHESTVKEHPSYKDAVKEIKAYIHEHINLRMEFAYRIVHELVRKPNNTFLEDLYLDETLPDHFVSTLKQELLEVYIPALVANHQGDPNEHSFFSKDEKLYERLKFFRSVWSVLITHPYALNLMREYQSLLVRRLNDQDLLKGESAKGGGADSVVIIALRRDIEKADKRLHILDKEINSLHSSADAQGGAFFNSFVPGVLTLTNDLEEGSLHQGLRKLNEDKKDSLQQMREKALLKNKVNTMLLHNVDSMLENLVAFQGVGNRLDSMVYRVEALDSTEVQTQRIEAEVTLFEDILNRTRTAYIKEKLRKKVPKAKSGEREAIYRELAETSYPTAYIYERFGEEGVGLKSFLVNFEEVVKKRIRIRGLSIESVLVNYMAIIHDDDLYDGPGHGIKRPDLKLFSKDQMYDFVMLCASILKDEVTQKIQEPVVIVVDPAIDVLTPNEVGMIAVKYSNIVAVIEGEVSPHAVNQFKLALQAVMGISGADIQRGDMVIVSADETGKGRISVRPNLPNRIRAYKEFVDFERWNDYYRTMAVRPLEVGGKPFHSFNSVGVNFDNDFLRMAELAMSSVGLQRLELMLNTPTDPDLWRKEPNMTTAFENILNKDIYSQDNADGVVGLYIPRLDDVGGEKVPRILEDHLDSIKERGEAEVASVKEEILTTYSGVAFYFYKDKETDERPFYEYGQRQLRALFQAYYNAENKRLGITFPNTKKLEGVMDIDSILNMVEEAKQSVAENIFKARKLELEEKVSSLKENLTDAKQDALELLEEKIGILVSYKDSNIRQSLKLFEEVKIGFYVEEYPQLVHYKEMVDKSDFIEIGTNDMTLSLFQRDDPDVTRVNSKYSHLFNQMQPRLLEVTNFMVKVSALYGKPLLISGDWGDSVRWAMLTVALAKKYDADIHPVSSPMNAAKIRTHLHHLEDINRLTNPEGTGILDPVFDILNQSYRRDFSKGFKNALEGQGSEYIEELTDFESEIRQNIGNAINKAKHGNPPSSGDDATLGKAKYGGIDLNDIELLRTNPKAVVRFNANRVKELLFHGEIQGFSPVILNVIPLESKPN